MTALRAKGSKLTVVGASAGSGKTYRLTTEIERAVSGPGAEAVRPEGLVAVTYTKRAQVELESRIRKALLRSKTPDRAASLPLAYLGTVHAVCFRWLRDHALDVGLSPDLEVLNDDGLLLAQVLEETIPAADREELDELADRLQMHVDTREGLVHWDQPVEDIITLARHGRIGPDKLAAMAERSWRGLLDLLPQPLQDGAALDETLANEVERALAAIAISGDSTAVTKGGVEQLRAFERSVGFGRATWAQWEALSRPKVAKRSEALVAGVIAAATYELHPQFHGDIRRFIELVFRAAALTLDRYASFKAERGLVDYVDMIDHALALLHDEEVASDLAQRLQLVVVDELQDSSPIQLALFLRLDAIAKKSAWVGDPKQCIFEYAGADPALMDAVVQWARRSGAEHEQLPINYRSRRALVELANRLFVGVFAGHGMAEQDVAVSADRPDLPELDAVPAVGIFHLDVSKQDDACIAIAAGIEAILADPTRTPVVDRVTRAVRAVAPGDVAVLVATNKEAEQIAKALADRAIRSVVARSGLMATPEGTALASALRYVLDERDTLAQAQLEALHGWDGLTPDAWLTQKLEAKMGATTAPPPAWRRRLDALRSEARILSPQELVEGVVVALDLAALSSRWPDAPMRLANLDALRKFARVYEQRCMDDGEGCSLAGLLRFLSTLTNTVYRHGDARQADEQHASSDAGAVTVMTYHRSKGLEWPVVVLASLDRGMRRVAFEVDPETDAAELDPDDPLAGRWIRYWPWPFGNHTAPLADRAATSQVGMRVTQRKLRERARLLYVGFTRPRDHLILAATVRSGRSVTPWLNELQHDGASAIALPSPDAESPSLTVGTGANQLSIPVRTWRLTAATPPPHTDDEPRPWFSRPTVTDRPPYWIQPSSAESSGIELPSLAVSAVHTIHMPLVREDSAAVEWNRVGDALHAFLAADLEGLSPAARSRIATRLLEAHGVLATYSAGSILSAADSFRAFVAQHHPTARWRREIPVEACVESAAGQRKIDGRIDLLLETDDALIIVDHKSFPGVGDAVWRMKAQAHAPQLATYMRALRLACPDRPISAWLHFANAGAVVVLDAVPSA